ncbi:secreted RxLR effector protein 161-like [Salvia miltiorrhiza]|uniref:secreted RxLR effector protein 161-like n=1 Tax=Salvia miltiorrhiza TaxID=226208 RepID=UPI0025AB9904|nr:secreted RxLR effector protein 161-like [Salvia miltiorrhiza]
MDQSKSVVVPMTTQTKLSTAQSPNTAGERKEMVSIPYSSAVGSIMYMMICTRPDLAYAISILSRFMADPGRAHWEALKQVLRYIKGTADCGVMFKRIDKYEGNPLLGFVDADFAANIDSRRSQTGYIFTLYGAVVSWRSLLQPVVSLSTTKAEYLAMTEAVKEGVWLKGMIADFGISHKFVTIFCDNQSALHLAKHQVFHERSKHIDVRYHFVRDLVNKGIIQVSKVPTEENPADCLTKPLQRIKFEHCLELVNVV